MTCHVAFKNYQSVTSESWSATQKIPLHKILYKSIDIKNFHLAILNWPYCISHIEFQKFSKCYFKFIISDPRGPRTRSLAQIGRYSKFLSINLNSPFWIAKFSKCNSRFTISDPKNPRILKFDLDFSVFQQFHPPSWIRHVENITFNLKFIIYK